MGRPAWSLKECWLHRLFHAVNTLSEGSRRAPGLPLRKSSLVRSVPDSDDLAVVAGVLNLPNKEVCDIARADGLVASGELAGLLGVVAGTGSVLDMGAGGKDVVQRAGSDGVVSALVVSGSLEGQPDAQLGHSSPGGGRHLGDATYPHVAVDPGFGHSRHDVDDRVGNQGGGLAWVGSDCKASTLVTN